MKQTFYGTCEWCEQDADDLVEHQDFEEGPSGRTYDVCAACRKKENENLKDEDDEN